MARALAEREKDRRFDLVHSSDVAVPGLFVEKSPNRSLLVRSSWARGLWLSSDRVNPKIDVQLVSFLERKLIRRADVAYAPSHLVASYYSSRLGRKMEVVRPPVLVDTRVEKDRKLPWKLPDRFLLHFGPLGPIKGTDVVAEALPLVWRHEPDFTMVFAGMFRTWINSKRVSAPEMFNTYSRTWGHFADRVFWLGEIERVRLHEVIKMAEASVLPSRIDNLPNTALESLVLGVPVVGTYGSSIDEIVEPGYSGELVPIGDPAALAEIMLKVWRREVNWLGKGFQKPSVMEEMSSEAAAANLLRLAGLQANNPHLGEVG
jgi:glycosyltransferase involved in cell wall biosynthesis